MAVQNQAFYSVHCREGGSMGCVVLGDGMDASPIPEGADHAVTQLRKTVINNQTRLFMLYNITLIAINQWRNYRGAWGPMPHQKFVMYFVGKSEVPSEILFFQYSDKIRFVTKVFCHRLIAMCMNVAVARNTSPHT